MPFIIYYICTNKLNLGLQYKLSILTPGEGVGEYGQHCYEKKNSNRYYSPTVKNIGSIGSGM